jgi:hypothetical protein
MMVRIKHSAIHLGEFALQVLQRQTSAVLSGVSRQGVYLQPKDDLVLFLSHESFRGPLTINLISEPAGWQGIQPGGEIHLSSTEILLSQENILVDLTPAEIWNPPLPNQVPSRDTRERQINELLESALRNSSSSDLLPLLESVESGELPSLPGIPGFATHINQFLTGFTRWDVSKTIQPLQDLLGFGPGLTPLGDDYILGVLLCLNWWREISPIQGLEDLNQQMLEKAREETSSLSASLLTCAVSGRADERIITILNAYFSGRNFTSEDTSNLLSWGSSSGIAVLAGMLSVLTRLPT